MSLLKWIFIGIIALPAAELVAFIMLAALIGWRASIALLLATSVVGLLLLRRSGRANLARLRAAVVQDGIRAIHLDTPGAASVVGGILIAFPGFITDVLGAALFVPALRRWAAGKLAINIPRASRQRDARVVDLEPDEWHSIPERHRRPRRGSEDDA